MPAARISSPLRPSTTSPSCSGRTGPTSGSTGRPKSCSPTDSNVPSAATPILPRRPTSWMCGSTPAPPTPPSWTSAPISTSPPTSIWRAATSTAAGSNPLCSPASPPRAWRPTGRSSPTGPWTARAGPCTSPWATPWRPKRSSRTTARTCSGCGWPPPTTPRICASPRTS